MTRLNVGVGPHTPSRSRARAHVRDTRVRPPSQHEMQCREHERLCGIDPLDAQLDTEREHWERLDRFNEMAGPGDIRWSLPEGVR